METDATCSGGSNVNLLENFIQNVRQENDNKRKIVETNYENNENEDINITMSQEEIDEIIARLRAIFSLDKSPIQVLHELFANNSNAVKIIDKGSIGQAHDPLHETWITIQNIGNFIGKAKSKQESKQKAAQNVISFFTRFLPLSTEKSKNKRKKKRNRNSDSASKSLDEYVQKNQTEKNEISLEEFLPNEIEFIPKQDSEIVEANNDEQSINITINIEPALKSYTLKFMQDADFSQLICEKVFEKWSDTINPINLNKLINKLISDERARLNFIQQDLWRYKEMAGFVLVSDIDKSVQVLCIGTGTKCLASENLSLDGNVVHDSHAEVMARRSLLQVLYDHLENLLANNLNDKPEFILEPSDSSGKRFRLKNHLKLHLFITSPPCGDARVFNFNENLKNNQVPKGVLRCKIEKGQGTVPMPTNYIATWDGILISTQRCTFMSCSDKIALWNVVGIQGSLLSLFLEPIYIESLVVSNLFRYTHLVRALHGRIDKEKMNSKLEKLPGYRLNECKVGFYDKLSFSSKDSTFSFIPSYSHNWYSHMEPKSSEQIFEDIEIIRCETGTNFFNDESSRLSKRNLLERFMNLITNYPDICQEIHLTEKPDDMNVEKLSISNCVDKNYHFVKHISRTYHQAKIGLFTTLKESNLRTWVPAPIDVDQFPILSSTLPQPPSSLSMQQQESEQNNDDSTTNNNNNDDNHLKDKEIITLE